MLNNEMTRLIKLPRGDRARYLGEEMEITAKDIVHAIFQNAKDKAATRLIEYQELKAFGLRLRRRQLKPVMLLRLLSGNTVNVLLHSKRHTLVDIQRDTLDRSLQSNHICLVDPHSHKLLPRNQDLRKLLPDIQELQVIVQSTLPTPEEVD